MKITPRHIQVGDQITISGTIKTRRDDFVGVAFDGVAGRSYITFRCCDLYKAEITRPEKPLEVGDWVKWGNGEDQWQIFGPPVEGWALVRAVVGTENVHFAAPLSELIRIEETADDAG